VSLDVRIPDSGIGQHRRLSLQGLNVGSGQWIVGHDRARIAYSLFVRYLTYNYLHGLTGGDCPLIDVEVCAVVPDKSKRLSVRKPLVVAAFGLGMCGTAWTARGVYVYWNDAKMVNFLAAWIPFVLSILIAFVPEHEMSLGKKWLWRASVILAGFAWSVVLWHQQVVTEIANQNDQQKIVNDAVNKANEHSDTEIGKVKTEVVGARTDLQLAAKQLGNIVAETKTDLNQSISKVGIPEPPEPVVLKATLWDDSFNDSKFPVRTLSIPSSADGSFQIRFTFRNISETAGSNIDVWIGICDQCSFVSEPTDYDRPTGTIAAMRHRMIQLMNPNTTMAVSTILVRTNKLLSTFPIAFKYACQACGKDNNNWQTLTIINPTGLNLGGVNNSRLSLDLPR
jgi:hypothetical protein